MIYGAVVVASGSFFGRPSARERLPPLFGSAAGVAGGRLRLPVYIARGFVAISGPSRDAAYGVGLPSAHERLPCLMALRL